MIRSKDVVIGMGEIGKAIASLLGKAVPVTGVDQLPERNTNHDLRFPAELLHICIPYNKMFTDEVLHYVKSFRPKAVVVHSTIAPHTTEKLQRKLKIPVVFSPVRGVHSRMLYDLKRYTKFYSYYKMNSNFKDAEIYRKRLEQIKIKAKFMSSPLVLEFAKILVDTTYYGWLITYSQITNEICLREKVDYDEMWEFADEIHKFLGNRPKMYPGYIAGHCVIPNLRLLDNYLLTWMVKYNEEYKKILDKLPRKLVQQLIG